MKPGTRIAEAHRSLLAQIEALWQVDLVDGLGLSDRAEAQRWVARLLEVVAAHDPSDLARWLVPQWVVLAAGLGTRIDPTGRINKNLDVWFGGYNTLQLSRRYLPGNLPHIIVLHPTLLERLRLPDSSDLDPEKMDAWLGPNAQVVVQPQPDGTGGALRAAVPLLEQSQAEFIGVAFGDEPFLSPALFVQTLVAHFSEEADVTLCGKIPETVVDKGGLFFDEAGRFQGTKEWDDMTPEEQRWMEQRLEQGCAYTNTGITLIRRQAALERLDRLTPHGEKQEYHHVDLIRHFYEDGLKTHAHIYRGEILAGVNRWSNVLAGERQLLERQRIQLAQQGVRVSPGSRIWLGEGRYSLRPQVSIGRNVHLAGEIFLGHGVRVGDYALLRDVSLSGASSVGSGVELVDVEGRDVHFESSPLWETIGTPVQWLRLRSSLRRCRLHHAWVGQSVHLESVEATYTLIPPGVELAHARLGLFQESLKGKELWLSPSYRPGTPLTSNNVSELERLEQRLFREWIPLATRDPEIRGLCETWVRHYLHGHLKDSPWSQEGLTLQQIAGVACEIVRLIVGVDHPVWHQLPRPPADLPSPPSDWHRLFQHTPGHILWLLGEKFTLSEEIQIISELIQAGHCVTLAAKSVAVLWDTTLEDVITYRAHFPQGRWRLIDTGSNILGVDLRQANADFWHALTNADAIVACGNNRETVRGLQHPLIIYF